MKMIKRVLMGLLIVVFLGCAVAPQPVTDSKGVTRPMDVLSPEFTKTYIDEMNPLWRVVGVSVDNDGSFIIWAEKIGTEQCAALIVAPTPDGTNHHRIVQCEQADQLRKHVCEELNHCTDNPYVDSQV